MPNYISNPRTLLSIREAYSSIAEKPRSAGPGRTVPQPRARVHSGPDSPGARAGKKKPLLRVLLGPSHDDSSCLPGTHGLSFSSQVPGPHASKPNPAVWRGTLCPRPMIRTGGAGDMFRCSSHPGNGGLLVLHRVEPYTRRSQKSSGDPAYPALAFLTS